MWDVVYVSVIAAEDVPVYHACPGAPVLRVVVPGSVIGCSECWWSELAGEGVVVRRTSARFVASRVRVLRAGLVLFDGGEPLASSWVLDAVRELRGLLGGVEVYFGVKTTGLVDPGVLGEAVRVFDYVLLEYHGGRDPGVLARRVFVENFEFLVEKARSLEIHFLFDGSRRSVAGVSGLVSRIPGSVGVHVVLLRRGAVEEDRAFRVVSRLRGRRRNVYLYGDTSFTTSDTFCPRCGAVIVSRKPWGVELRGVVEGDGSTRCAGCGERHRWLIGCRAPRRHNVHREHVVF